jgi:tRNA nucleotidyltransferase (CCA-adding enzyme)
VIARVEPSLGRTREARRLAARLMRDLRRHARERGLRVEPRLVGSLAKDTHLSDPLDVDVFVLFPPTTARSVLEKQGIALGKAVLRRPVLKYAEHPYVHGRVGDLDVDIVPAYKLRDPTGKLSAVDRTPFHTDYVRRRASARHRREIRLLKRFLRGIGAYGAETAVGGVSGYLAELLVLRYGTLDRTLEAVASWRPPVELALEGTPTDLGGPLVFVDPVDASRNAAAAVRPETLERMRRAARAYRRRPRLEFFFPGPPKVVTTARLAALLAKRPTLGLEAPRPQGRPETVRPQAQRLAAKLARALEQEGFAPGRTHVDELEGGRVLILVEHRPGELPATDEHRGPRADDAANVERFLEKWKGRRDVVRAPRPERGRWVVTVRRDRRTPVALLADRLEDLLRGFEFERGEPPRLLAGDGLAQDPRRRLALTVFLKRLDPWQS